MDNEQYQVRNMLVLEDDMKKKVVINKEPFTLKYLDGAKKKEMDREMAQIGYSGLPVNSFSMDGRYLIERDTTINYAVVDSPSWWKDADACIDEVFKDELFKEYKKWEKEFEEKLKKNKLTKRSPQT